MSHTVQDAAKQPGAGHNVLSLRAWGNEGSRLDAIKRCQRAQPQSLMAKADDLSIDRDIAVRIGDPKNISKGCL